MEENITAPFSYIAREDIKNCPTEATHVYMNPTNEFIQLFYKVKGDTITYFACNHTWFYSMTARRCKNFIDKLVPII